ncbi:MAG TPA: CDP-alcohol phosphatidyltransferase family protein [Clostridia bacterium]|nr:CDP-alcohol phosphatidyltransferase family protein [Clostridia bacterium]
MKRLPNLLSCLRMLLAVALPFLAVRPVLFFMVYLVCGITDAADGYLARRFRAETALGSRLDSAGDFVFSMACLATLLTIINAENNRALVSCALIVTAVRVVNITITKAKFKCWGIMHTIGNKLTGLVLFVMLPVWVCTKDIACWSIIAVGMVAFISAVEEAILLFKSKTYDADTRSIVALRSSSAFLSIR